MTTIPFLRISSIINQKYSIDNRYVRGSGVGALAGSSRAALQRRAGNKCCESTDIPGSGSIAFNGVDQYATLPASALSWLPGIGDFTVEWFMQRRASASRFPRVFSIGIDTEASLGCSVEDEEGDLHCYIWPYGDELAGYMPPSYNDYSGWTHVAVSRRGTNIKLFIAGVKVAEKTDDSHAIVPEHDFNLGVDDPTVGNNWWAGNLTNFRWTNKALYTGDSLTVPQGPLLALPSTALLLLGGYRKNPVADAAKHNTVVNHGGQWTPLSPF